METESKLVIFFTLSNYFYPVRSCAYSQVFFGWKSLLSWSYIYNTKSSENHQLIAHV